MAIKPTITSASNTGTNDDNVIFGSGQTEVQRLDMQHQVIYDSMPQLVCAPVDLSKGGLKILDQATGSGIWIRDVRASTGGAQNTWIGTDIEDSYFPNDPPSDTTYYHQSMTEQWPKDWEGTFDLVHSRYALPGVGINKLEDVVKNLIALVKPGGWIQLVEVEWDEWKVGPEGRLFHDALKELMSMVSTGQGVDLREKLASIFAGLKNIDCKIVGTRYGALASEEIRETSEKSLFATAMGVTTTTKMLPPLSISRESLDSMPQRLLDEVKKDGIETKMFALWAQKPAR